MRYRLRTLLILLAIAPPLLAATPGLCRAFTFKSALTQIEKLEKNIADYRADVGMPPPDLEALMNPPPEVANVARWQGPYRANPLPVDQWGNPFEYERLTKTRFAVFAKGYRIWSKGPDGISGTNDDATK
jgi:hypothetical protein